MISGATPQPKASNDTLRILGIDPGTRVVGYGVVDLWEGRIVAVAAGVWRLGEKLPLHDRLAQLSRELQRAIDAFTPCALCLEMAFVAENVRSALALGHARGVVLSQAALAGLAISEMSATAAKKNVVAFGQASKEHVAAALERLLGVSFQNVPLDASDALSLAYAQARKEIEKTQLSHGPDRDLLIHGAQSASYLSNSTLKGNDRKKSKKKVGFEIFLGDSCKKEGA
jgi:crossover junction endodeoxyribonuclease RuvC